jgi:hypothetical protein
MQNTQKPDSNHLQFHYQLHFQNFTQITSGTATRKQNNLPNCFCWIRTADRLSPRTATDSYKKCSQNWRQIIHITVSRLPLELLQIYTRIAARADSITSLKRLPDHSQNSCNSFSRTCLHKLSS